jgi:hypothetical protein
MKSKCASLAVAAPTALATLQGDRSYDSAAAHLFKPATFCYGILRIAVIIAAVIAGVRRTYAVRRYFEVTKLGRR